MRFFIVQTTDSTLETPVHIVSELFSGGINSAGRLKLTLSPLAIVRLL